MTKRIRIAEIGRLKPDMIDEYERLHREPWPGVLKMISECRLENYSIFREGTLVFSYFEYVGDDYEADMAKMAADPLTQEWWTHTHPCFETFSVRPDAMFTAEMKQIFHLD